jgi:hypothetical protein
MWGRSGGPVGTGPGAPVLRPLDQTQVLIGRVVNRRSSFKQYIFLLRSWHIEDAGHTAMSADHGAPPTAHGPRRTTLSNGPHIAICGAIDLLLSGVLPAALDIRRSVLCMVCIEGHTQTEGTECQSKHIH